MGASKLEALMHEFTAQTQANSLIEGHVMVKLDGVFDTIGGA